MPSSSNISWRSAGRWLLRIGGGILAVVLLILVLVIGLLQTPWGADRVRAFAVDQANALLAAEVSIERMDGNFLSNLHLYGVRITHDRTPLLQADTVSVSYSLTDLLNQTVHIRSFSVNRLDADLRQYEDGTWNVTRMLPEPTGPDTAALAWDIMVDRAELGRGHVMTRFYKPEGDSLLEVNDLSFLADSLAYTGDMPTIRIDRLGADITGFDRATTVELQTRAVLNESEFAVDSLRMTTAHSNIFGEVTYPWSNTSESRQDIHAYLQAQPLVLDDLRAFVPAVPASDTLQLTARLMGSGKDLALEANGDLSRNGSLTVNATFTDFSQPTLRYEGTARVQNLNITRLTASETGLTNMSAEVNVDLRGPSLEQLSGTAGMRADRLEWDDQPIRPTRLETRWDEGHIAFDGRTELVRGYLSVKGETNPFADVPSYALTSQFEQLNLERLPGLLEETGLTGSLTLSGSRFEPEEIALDAELNLQPSRYASYDIREGRLGAHVTQGAVDLNGTVTLNGGEFSAAASVRPFAEPMTYELNNGRFRAVNLAILMNDTTMTSNLNGSFAAGGEGTNPDSLRLEGAVELDGSSYLDRDIERGELQAGLDAQQLSFDGSLTTPGGSLRFEGGGRPLADVPSLERVAVSFRSVDVGFFMQDTTYTSDLNGRLTGRAAGMEPADAVVNAELRLDTSRVNEQTVHRASASLALEDGTAAVTLDGEMPGGTWGARGTARPFDEQPTYSIETARFAGLDVGSWIGSPGISTNLTGTAELSGRGFDPEQATIEGEVRLDSSRVNNMAIHTGTLDLQLADQRLESNLDLTYPTGRTNISAEAVISGPPVSITARGRVRELPAFELAGIDTLEGSMTLGFDVSGSGETWSSMEIDGTVSSGSSQLAGIEIDSVYSTFAYREDGIRADTVIVQSNVLDLTGAGVIALPDTPQESQFRFTAAIDSLSPLGYLAGYPGLQGSGDINGRVSNASRTLRFDIDTNLSNIGYSGVRAAELDLRVLGDYRETLAMEVRSTVNALSAATIVVDEIESEAFYSDQIVDFNTNWIIDSEREGLFRGQVELEPGNERAIIDSLSMRMDQQRWNLLQQATIAYSEQFVVSDFLVYSGNQQVAIDGIFAPGGEHDLITTIDNVQIDPFTDLFGYAGVGGNLNGSVVLTGTAESPVLNSSLTVDAFSSHGREVGDMHFEADYRDLLLDLRARLAHQAGRDLRVEGQIPFNLSAQGGSPTVGDSLNISAQADSVSIAWVEPFVDPTTAREIGGFLTADVTVGGTFETPNTGGYFRLAEGSMRLPTLGTRYTDMNLHVVHDDSTATIKTATIHSGDGEMNVTGVVHLTALNVGTFDLQIRSDDFRATGTSSYRVSLDSDVTLSGTTSHPILRGEVTLTEGTFNLDEQIASQEVEAITLTDRDLRQLESRFGIYVSQQAADPYDFYEAMTIDTVNVSITRDVWLRSSSGPEMAIEFTGDLSVVKPEQGDIEAFGTIEVIPTRSYVAQFGRRFDITTGTLTFNGPVENPILNIQAEYNMRSRSTSAGSAQISLGLEGPLDDLRFDLGSEQGLTNVEIISYLVLGRPPGQSVRGTSSSVGDMATTAAMSQLTQMMEGLAAQELGLDVVEIQHDQELGATLTAGTYLTSNLFTSVSWPISLTGQQSAGATNRRITIEYILSNWLVLQLQRESDVLGLELLWEYSY